VPQQARSVEKEDNWYHSIPPHDPRDILEGPKDEQEFGTKASGSRKSAEVDDIEDSDDQYHSTPPRDPRHLLEGPEEEPDAISIADSDNVPEKPAESAEAELS
jgi:hypothetical protein